MKLSKISILNYKNLAQVELSFSPKVNCLIGHNGMGKTNLLDAIYYLSFCKSAINPIDSQNISHDEDFFVIQGFYETDNNETEEVYCGLKRKVKKQFKRNKKEYQRLSDHIGFIPLVMVSPDDILLIAGGSEERRRFMDVVISQYDRAYLEALIRYNKALQQRNSLLKQQEEPDAELFAIWEEMMATEGEQVYAKRKLFIDEFIPIFQHIYSFISQGKESVSLEYVSHADGSSLLNAIQSTRQRDRIIGYSTKGIHKDEITMDLGGFPIKREGSQGQNKTYLIALKLAQFIFLKEKGDKKTPILLLDDIFDKLDARRVERIVQLVQGDNYGQIFITDTNRDHLDNILHQIPGQYKVFLVDNGQIDERKENEQ